MNPFSLIAERQIEKKGKSMKFIVHFTNSGETLYVAMEYDEFRPSSAKVVMDAVAKVQDKGGYFLSDEDTAWHIRHWYPYVFKLKEEDDWPMSDVDKNHIRTWKRAKENGGMFLFDYTSPRI